MDNEQHYLKKELYQLIQQDTAIFEFLQYGSLDGIWYWDIEAPAHEWMSPQFWTILGFDPDKKKPLAAEWQELINPDDLQVALDNFNKHCADPNHPYDQVVRYKHKDGSTVWVRCRGIAIRDKAGKPLRMLGAHNDITALKQTEEALLKKTHALEEANRKLEETISGMLPICASCKKIRDDQGYWNQVEVYIREHSSVEFTHSICPDCAKQLYPEIYE